MRKWFARWTPDRERIHNNRWLRWLGPSLLHPRLWHFSRRGVAVGVAVGVFFGLLVPIAQIPLSAMAAIMLRANVPTAVTSTLVTNPFTFAPIYVAAHRLGSALLGQDTDSAPPSLAKAQELPESAGWAERVWHRLQSVGKPLLLGLVVFAVVSGLLTYGLIMLLWRIMVVVSWRRRRRRKSPQRNA